MTLLPENALSSLRDLAGLCSLYQELGYPTDKPETFTPEDIGMEGAAPLIRQATLITDLEDSSLLLQHWHFELKEPLTTAGVRRVAEDFLKRSGEYLLSFSDRASDYTSVQFVKPRRETQEGGKTIVRLSKLTVVPAHPTGHDLSVLRAIDIKPGTSAQVADAKQREAFSVERVTKRFFETYARLFRHVREVIRTENLSAVIQTSPKRTVQPKAEPGAALTETQIDNEKALHAFTQRLLGRLLFLYFIQKKGWLGGEAQYITALYRQAVERGGNFYRDALEPLYFETLSTPDPRGAGLPDEQQIPYLNGSLFEREYPDSTVLNLPNSLFDPKRAETATDDPGGILRVLNGFNFTVGESAALEQDISLDPEMLGKVFENLMEEEDAAKSGTFYTPRSIVQYMAEETLTRYLADHSHITQERLLTLCADDSETHDLSNAEARQLRALLATVRVLDPAVGTASMLVGFLNAMIRVRRSLEARILKTLIPNGSPAIADWKREYVQHCLYGVDIKHEAIEIARLRLWLSLVVDATDPEPLPNLDYKLMAGDGLLETVDGSPLIKAQTKQFGGQGVVTAKADEIGRLHDRFYSEQNYEQKRELRRQIQQCERELFKADIDDRIKNLDLELTGLNREIADVRQGESARSRLIKRHTALADNLAALLQQKRKVWDEGEPLPFFLHNVHFGEVMSGEARDGNGGFDIVLGNPPYVSIGHMTTVYKTALKNAFPEVAAGRADLYVYFFQKGLNLLRAGGRLAYITPNKYTRAVYGENLRGVLTNRVSIETLIDFGDLPVFDATTYPFITILQRSAPTKRPVQMLPERFLKAHLADQMENGVLGIREGLNSFHIFARQTMIPLDRTALTAHEWTLDDPRVLRLMNKLNKAGKPLGELIAGKFYRGIVTGYNRAFIIKEDERKELIAADPKNAEVIKPFLRGRDVRRWRVQWGGLYLLAVNRGFPIEEYPAIKAHLEQYRAPLSARSTVSTHKWYELQQPQQAYWPYFESGRKIIYQEISSFQRFGYSDGEMFFNNKCFVIPTNEAWLLAVLNSRVVWAFLGSIVSRLVGNAFALQEAYMQLIPIPTPTPAQILALEAFADDSHLPELNALIYELYGLNADERALVEGLTVGAYEIEGETLLDSDDGEEL